MSTTNPLDPQVQNARQAAIDAAYAGDGRHDPAHPRHGVYTGLLEQPLPVVITEEEDEEELLLREVDDRIDAANDAAKAIDARLARLGLRLTEQSIEKLWAAASDLTVVELESQADG
jgi:hypothetical protein